MPEAVIHLHIPISEQLSCTLHTFITQRPDHASLGGMRMQRTPGMDRPERHLDMVQLTQSYHWLYSLYGLKDIHQHEIHQSVLQ